MPTTTNLTTLKINYLTQAQYDDALANNQINSNELYFTPQAPELEITYDSTNERLIFSNNSN